MKTVLLVFGTRPEAIKMCPLVQELQRRTEEFRTVVCVTGQHREMLDQVLRVFEVTPDYDLDIMKQGQDLYDITSRVLLGLRDVLAEVRPDVVLVHGDTTTSMAAALAAFYQQIPVGHVEAGLRTYNLYSPWPEEVNRQITSRISTYHFAPTALSQRNLMGEHLPAHTVTVTGNTVIDALHQVVEKLQADPTLAAEQEAVLLQAGYEVRRLGSHSLEGFSSPNSSQSVEPRELPEGPLSQGRKLVLITGHRRENFGDGFIRMLSAMRDLSVRYPQVDFVYPMHLNPHVRRFIREVFTGMDTLAKGKGWGKAGNFFFIEPLQYLEFVYLMEKSYIVLTDSGGLQEEAPGLGKPVLVMRDTTERPEALWAGTARLVGTDYAKIVAEVSALLDDREAYEKMSAAVNPYGDGQACRRIADTLAGREVSPYDPRNSFAGQ